MKRFDDSFPSTLVGFELDTLENDPHSVFAIAADYSLIYFNPAFLTFAAENGGEPKVSIQCRLGSNLLDSISGVLRCFYASRFADVLKSGKPWHQEYHCHSPQLFREFHQSVFPLRNGRGLVMINSLKVERPMEIAPGEAQSPIPESYVQDTGLITQCSNCRRTLRNDKSSLWDWVPEWVAQSPANTSHSICSTCYDYYWKRPSRSH